MASFSLSTTKRDLWEKVKKQKQHMKHVDYLSKQNIWKSSMHERAYNSHNKNVSSSIPSGITKTGLGSGWSTPHKKYKSPEARHIHRSVHVSPVTKITTKKKKVSPKAMKEDERLKIKKDSTFGSTPRPPNHSPGMVIGDNQVFVSKPYNGFEGGKPGLCTRDIEWKAALRAPNMYNVQDQNPWLKKSFNVGVKKQMRIYKKQPHVKLPRRRLANLKEVEKRYEKMGFPANKLESKILPKFGDSNNNPSSAEDAISTDAKKEKDNVSIEET